MAVPLTFMWIWVEIKGLPPTLATAATARLVGETIGPILQIDQSGLNRSNARVHITLPLNDPVRLERRIRVSLVDVLQVSYCYERLLGCCRDCMMINHGGLRCPRVLEDSQAVAPPPTTPPTMVFRASASGSGSTSLSVPAVSLPKEKMTVSIRDVPKFPSPTKITGVRRGRDEDDFGGGKRVKHSLAMIPLPMNPEEIGLSVQASSELAIIKTGKSSKKRVALVVVGTRRRPMMWCRRRRTQCLLVRQKVEV
ncbi:hypothetical protein ACLB2K_072787 [Fragaria x ananassa]